MDAAAKLRKPVRDDPTAIKVMKKANELKESILRSLEALKLDRNWSRRELAFRARLFPRRRAGRDEGPSRAQSLFFRIHCRNDFTSSGRLAVRLLSRN